MKKHYLIIPFLFALSLQAQDCDCFSNYNWVKTTFEENDAGFDYALSQKGHEAYEQHNKTMLEKVKNITDLTTCTQTLFEWLRFFRSGHIGISLMAPQNNNDPEQTDEDEIRQRFADWESLSIKAEDIKAKVQPQQETGFEGIWESPPYQIGIIRQGEDYVGVLLEADGVWWRKGQVKLRIRKTDSGYAASYYMRDHSAREFESVELIGNNLLTMGFISLNRLYPELPTDAATERYLRHMESRTPFLDVLNEKTLILRIPDFSYSEKKLIDSVIQTNLTRLLQTENLIIDLRNNGGGSDESFRELMPLIYTNPVRVVGLEFRSTKLNNQRMYEFTQDTDWPEEDRKWALEAYKKLEEHPNSFVNIDGNYVDTFTLEEIHPYPKNVGIIVNGGCGSTTEQFLLAAKQSKKVKLFGTTTFGSLDISNMYFIPSPCEEFTLGYCLSKSYRIPDMAIDEKGIQPDIFIDRWVPKNGWIDFVADYYK